MSNDNPNLTESSASILGPYKTSVGIVESVVQRQGLKHGKQIMVVKHDRISLDKLIQTMFSGSVSIFSKKEKKISLVSYT